ncbi:MAG TPA: molybdenum cofactor guanylyltransferase MobA [Burkholderiaceae bacterium]|jgi:molybdopterin-guanine dinucleotide biosynthesis protein A
MGGRDKGLQMLAGRPMVQHVMARLAPQVGSLMISANRNVEAYAELGVRVLRDAEADFQGPLAGLLVGMRAAATEWILCAPCDAPLLPLDLAARLSDGDEDVSVALPCSSDGRVQPLFALLRCEIHERLAATLARGERGAQQWMSSQRHRLVRFERPDDERAFFNINSLAQLQALQTHV